MNVLIEYVIEHCRGTKFYGNRQHYIHYGNRQTVKAMNS